MTDISNLQDGDIIVFSKGHESPVTNITTEDERYMHVWFIDEHKLDQNLFFLKHNGIAPGTSYHIIKIIKEK